MQVAAVQIRTTLDVGKNRRRIVERIGEAAGAGAVLVVLPEAAMCTFGEPGVDLTRVAEALDGPFVAALQGAASRQGVTVVAGMFERSPDPVRVFNTTVVVAPSGVVGAYRKLHLFDALGSVESDRVAPGDPEDGVVTFEVADVTVGVMTCYDLRFPEMARALVDRGVTLLAVPAHWYSGPGKAETWEILVRARAIESTAYVVAAGKPAPEGVGRSMVVDPAGPMLRALGADVEGCAVAEVCAARVAEVRAQVPVLEHRRFGVHAQP